LVISPTSKRTDERAQRGRAQAADDDHDEDQHVDLRTHLRNQVLLEQTPHHAAQAGERAADHEHTDEQLADAVAERLHHLAVLHAGAHQQADLGAAQRPDHAAANTEAPTSTASRRYLLDRRVAQDAASRAAYQAAAMRSARGPRRP
jgi:hypothetical protein